MHFPLHGIKDKHLKPKIECEVSSVLKCDLFGLKEINSAKYQIKERLNNVITCLD